MISYTGSLPSDVPADRFAAFVLDADYGCCVVDVDSVSVRFLDDVDFTVAVDLFDCLVAAYRYAVAWYGLLW